MYTIKEAASRSGVAINTLRAWERRYGVVTPARTPSGYRVYDDDAIQTLGAMRRLVSTGVQPSVAAAELGKRGLQAALAGIDSQPASRGLQSVLALSAEAEEVGRLAERFVAAAATLDERAITSVLDDLFARGSFERVASDLLFPALQRLGDAWVAGHVSVAGEHLASHLVLRRLSQIFDGAGTAPTVKNRVLVGLPPGSRHELGALAFAIAARRAGLPVSYLGADLPINDWLTAATTASAAVIGVPTARDRRAAAQVASALTAQSPHLVVALGGDGAKAIRGATVLPDRFEDAVSELRRAIARVAQGDAE